MPYIPQIVDSVILAVSVYVVDLELRPNTVMEQPSKMSANVSTTKDIN
jgi:hypothetical protein